MTGMRVIAGALKGRPLFSVPGFKTRPTSDRVKEAIFNLVPNRVYRDGYGLDLFAGTGSLGIEALSRGCSHVIFVDYAGQAVKIIKKNIQELGLKQRSEVYKQDAIRAVHILAKKKQQFNIIFLDPPYSWEKVNTLLDLIAKRSLLMEGGILVFESAKERPMAERYDSLTLYKRQIYGDTAVHLYTKEELT